MKALSKKIRNGWIQKFNAADLGINKRGKGNFPRYNYMCDEQYKKNYDRIFRKKDEPSKSD